VLPTPRAPGASAADAFVLAERTALRKARALAAASGPVEAAAVLTALVRWYPTLVLSQSPLMLLTDVLGSAAQGVLLLSRLPNSLGRPGLCALLHAVQW